MAVALVTLVFTWPRLMPKEGLVLVDVPQGDGNSGSVITMQNPQFSGYDRDAQPFTIIAESARQESPDSKEIELQQPRADITLKNGAWLALTAERGHYRRGSAELRLSGAFSLFHDQGFEVHGDDLRVDLQSGSAWSESPVDAQGPAGHITGAGLVYLDKGRQVVFVGPSRLVIYREAQ